MNATTATAPALVPEIALPAQAKTRLTSMDAFRGFVMLLMVAEVLHLGRVAELNPGSGFWSFLGSQQSHREWVGCSLHDLIQPSFTFLVGVALPFSISSRIAKGQTFGRMVFHAVWRSLLLIFLGIFLRSMGQSQTNYTFEDTLTQIGLGYTFAFLLAFRPVRVQWIALGVILAGYWAWFALHPLPGPNFNWNAVGVEDGWEHHLTGFAQHWDKNSNAAAAFDTWFLNLFPRERPFEFNGGGYLTMSFIPTLGTMLFGLMAGQWLRSEKTSREKCMVLLAAGGICLAVGTALHFAGICPIVKRIWTPSWTIFSAGWAFLILAAFYWTIDMQGWRKWAFPLVVIGLNSIFTYCIAHVWDRFIISSFKTHFGQDIFNAFGPAYSTLLSGTAVIVVIWLILYWMYRRRIFLKI